MDAQTHNRHLRFQLHAVWLLSSLMAANTDASEPLPKKDPESVYVAVERARIYAGPSSDFYPTGEAQRGAALEVHHRTSNGWLGIRPPQGSFSWVPASQAYLLPGGRLIEITDASAVSWIGTDLGSAKQYRWQVQLNVGEQLSVLGEASIKNGTEEREALWYRVAPPAGEFRWIEQAAVSKTPADNLANAPSTDSQVAQASAASPVLEGAAKSTAGVQTASFEGAAKPASASRAGGANRSPRNAQPSSTKPHRAAAKGPTAPSNGNQWDGWYAFEMNEQGVRTPFLDKLSGRDRGPATTTPKPPLARHDPLTNDPFSLAMAGEPAKPSAEEVTSSLRQVREWRDPRGLRDARLANSSPGSLGSFVEKNLGRNRAGLDPQYVQPASAGNPQSSTANRDVSTAGYDRGLPPPTGSGIGEVNWYGLSTDSPNTTAASSAAYSPLNPAMNRVVTSTADVGELQLELNNIVAASNGPWNLAPLADRARYLIEHGPAALDRGQARLLLERIDAFQNVSARSQPYAGPFPVQAVGYQSPPLAPMNAPQSSLPDNNSGAILPSAGTHYDATGWLVPVHAGGPDQPTHALTNDTGDIVAYVSPIAGLNLDRYRNQAVGITGLRGYLPQLQAAHLQAQRVSRIR